MEINTREAVRAVALDELNKYRCTYDEDGGVHAVTEYGLEWFTEDEDGEFLCGCDYDFAPGFDD